MKKFISVVTVILMLTLLLTSCGKPSPDGDITGYAEKVSIDRKSVV